jgi:hypothetical protein
VSRLNLLVGSKRTCLVMWKPVGSPYAATMRTRCEVVEQKFIPECDLALGEQCGLNDTEDLQEEGVIEGRINEHHHRNMSVLCL